MRTKIGKIAVLLFAVVMCLACFNMNVYAAYSEIEAVGTTVELDGTNDSTVTVSLSAANGFALLGIQGVWATSEDGETNYFTLVDLGLIS